MTTMHCEICGGQAEEIHVRVISADPNDPPCYYLWQCENHACPRSKTESFTTDEPGVYRIAQWSKFSRACGCQKISVTFSGETNTGVFSKYHIIKRDPQWEDVWAMIKDWLTKRPRNFLKTRMGFVVEGKTNLEV